MEVLKESVRPLEVILLTLTYKYEHYVQFIIVVLYEFVRKGITMAFRG
jgi:hypothetical protein